LDSAQLVLAIGDARTDVDFGVRGTASLAGVVYNDKNGNGRQDPGETGLGDVTIDVTWTGPAGPVTIPVVTDPSGAWSQANLPAGSYTVKIEASTQPSGYRLTTPSIQSVTLAIGGSAFVSIGLTTLPLAITGTPLFPGLLLALVLVLAGIGTLMARRWLPVRGQARGPRA
jgi:hypothetical protein